MGKKEFENFLNNESDKKAKSVNWDEKINRWKSYINSFYKNVNEWLKEYIVAGKIKIDTHDIEIYEEATGKYIVQEMLIKIGDNKIILKPIGTVLIGTIGRIDIIGKSKIQKVILADKNASGPQIGVSIFTSDDEKTKHDEKLNKLANTPVNWEWKLTTNPPYIKYSELNQETFFECLMSVING